jgi:endonuclease/exonuclease/phosphatase family metal-dependent hydrolase
VTWNLFHGRDRPPGKELYGLGARLLVRDVRGTSHIQVNRSLREEFTTVLRRDPWDVLFLQEAPPRWHGWLGESLDAAGAMALTSRNLLGSLRGRLADWNPDLMGAQEGGSNQILARAPWRVAATRTLLLARLPERRVMLAARLEHPDRRALWVANLHASFHSPAPAEREVLAAAGVASSLAAGAPLVFGGDLNLRPATSPGAFGRLAELHGLTGPTAPRAIDHLLVAGMGGQPEPAELPVSWRELPDSASGLRLRLSDHPGVAREIHLPPSFRPQP